MKTPPRLLPLLEDGIIDEIIKPLRSGKEADIYVVVSEGEVRCAKVYKEQIHRSFHNQALYQEGRKSRNSRDARAMGKHTRFGKIANEEAWQQSEVDTLFRLHNAKIRVPIPYMCLSGVLIMELLLNNEGEVAPQLGDIEFSSEEALYCHGYLLHTLMGMLLEGVVHADLSEFNILMTYNGPVIIDFPQSVDATANNNAQHFFERDVHNITHFFGRFAPELLALNFGKEIWQHYSDGTLTSETRLTGIPRIDTKAVDLESIIQEIDEAREEAQIRIERKKGDHNGERSSNFPQRKSTPQSSYGSKQPESEPRKPVVPKAPEKAPVVWGRRV